MIFDKKYLGYIKIAFKFKVSKRVMTLFWVLTKPIALIVSVTLWTTIYNYSGQGTLAGLTLNQTINYIMFNIIFSGLASEFIGQLLGQSIQNGKLTGNLLEPVDFGTARLYSHIGDRWGYTSLFEVIPGLLIGVLFFGFQQFNPIMTILSIVSLFFGFIINYFISINWALMYFRTIEYDHFEWLKRTIFKFFSGTYIPLNFFPIALQKVMDWIPLKYTTYVPAMIYINSYTLTQSILLLITQIAWVVGLYALYRVAWHYSIKQFAGVGT